MRALLEFIERGERAAVALSRDGMRIALVAGEASGDLLGAGLVAANCANVSPTREFAGVGGDAHARRRHGDLARLPASWR